MRRFTKESVVLEVPEPKSKTVQVLPDQNIWRKKSGEEVVFYAYAYRRVHRHRGQAVLRLTMTEAHEIAADAHRRWAASPRRIKFPFSIARKPHVCCLCGETIKTGEKCKIWSYPWDGTYVTDHAHPECMELTKGWKTDDWEVHSPGDLERPKPKTD